MSDTKKIKNDNNEGGFVLGVYDDDKAAEVTPKARIANFFYHYKWHTIIALFLIFAIVICSLQLCSRTKYDTYIMYAGGTDIGMTVSSATGQSEYLLLCDAVKKYTEDFNGDGNTVVNLQNLFLPSEEQIAEIEANRELEVNYRLIADSSEIFRQNIYTGEYYICFIAEHLYDEWTKRDTVPFAKISQYAGADADYEYAGEYGIYLRSTDLYSEAGFSMLGEDTVICIRLYSEVSLVFGDKENLEVYKNSERVLRAMLGG